MTLVGAGATMAVGIPVAVRLARVGWSSDPHLHGNEGFGQARTGSETSGFTPLDLGPDPMQWPSANAWPTSNLPVPDWPSKLWDDEHFGRQWSAKGGDVGPAGAAGQSAAAPSKAPSPRAQSKKGRPNRSSPKKPSSTKADAARRAAARKALEQRQAARTPAPAPTPSPQPSGPTPPSRDELVQMVERIGLAATVKEIMNRTGWDFRDAAQHLAKVRGQR